MVLFSSKLSPDEIRDAADDHVRNSKRLRAVAKVAGNGRVGRALTQEADRQSAMGRASHRNARDVEKGAR